MTDKFPIEKGVPLPVPNSKTALPLDEMEVGDSFLLPARKIVSARQRIYMKSRGTGRKYTTRRMASGEYRIWRIM